MSEREKRKIVWPNGRTTIVDLCYPELDDVTPQEIEEVPLRHFYTYNDVTTEFKSHHGRFMLEKAVFLNQSLAFEEELEQTLNRITYKQQPIFTTTVELLNKTVKRLNLAATQWWYPEAEHLVRYFRAEVLDFAIVVEQLHVSCGPTRPCSHKNWYATGSPVERCRFRK